MNCASDAIHLVPTNKQKKPGTPNKSNARLLLKNSTSYGIRTRDLRLERAASKAARRTRLVAAVCIHTLVPTLGLYSIHIALSSKICYSSACNEKRCCKSALPMVQYLG